MTTQRQIETAAKAISAVWESHGDGYLSAGLFEAMARAALAAAVPVAKSLRCYECDNGVEPEQGCPYD